MNAIVYLLQVSACLALFYGFYYIMLNRLTFFTINRYYLLFTLVLSFVVPLLTITVNRQYESMSMVQQVVNIGSSKNIRNLTVAPFVYVMKPRTFVTWMQLLQWTYVLAVAGLFTRLLITLVNFFRKLKRRKIDKLGNVHVLRGDKNLPNGSFLNYIFLNEDTLSAQDAEQIVTHELLHVKLYHSADRLLMKMVQIILWFNPFVYLYARSMEENHEFEVDREMGLLTDKSKYADLLLNLSIAKQGMLYHSFSKVPLKKRITMLFNKPSAKVKRVVYIFVIPVVLVSCLAFANIKKEDIKNFSLAKSTKKIINAIKNGQDNIVAQLNQPVQLPAAILNTDSAKTANIARPDGSLPATNDTTRYEIFDNISKNAKVIIDGKEYPRDILYEINNNNLSSISINKTSQNAQMIVDLKTNNGQIIYMTPHEKDNLRKEKSTPISQFYTRLQLTKDNGERYDYIVVRIYNAISHDAEGQISHVPGLHHSSLRIGPDDKVGFMINGKLYSEDEIKTIPQTIITSLNRFGSATYRPDMLYQNKYKFLFTLNSPDYDNQATISKNGGGGRIYDNTIPSVLSEGDTARKFLKNYRFAGYPVDTISYKARAYKTGLSPISLLIELVKKLPDFATKENAIYIGGKVINDLYIDGKEYAGYVIQGLKSLPAGNVVDIKITSPDPKNRNPAIMYIMTKPN